MIRFFIRAFVFLLLVLISSGTATAQPAGFHFMESTDLRVCPVETRTTGLPNFDALDCQTQRLAQVDLKNRMLWIKGTVTLPGTRGPDGQPLSLYISGAMASEAYLNGHYIGKNGTPGHNAATEIVGRMDAQPFPLREHIEVGDNEIVLLVSSFHNRVGLTRPFHAVTIAPSGIHANGSLSRYIPALVTLGLFLVSGIYFGIMGCVGHTRTRFWTLSAMCFFAAAQLIFEALRGLWPYDYPFHAIRLIGITIFSVGFGLSVTYHVFQTFLPMLARRVMAGVCVVTIVTVLFVPGYDYKAMVGMILPLAFGLAATGLWSYKRRPRAFVFFLTLLMFVGAIVLFRGLFLDSVFFFLVAFFLLILFVEQAFLLAAEARQRRLEEARAEKLQMALAEAGERTEAQEITIRSAGKIERIATNQIMHCSGAGGYSEITLTGGRAILHSATLNELEETLPATFLRVHRSHLINVMFLKTLKRDVSGTGTLTLLEDITVPVSRRIMPKVRERLN